jgi:hypothetical protein
MQHNVMTENDRVREAVATVLLDEFKDWRTYGTNLSRAEADGIAALVVERLAGGQKATDNPKEGAA